jgi:hypothetical protein
MAGSDVRSPRRATIADLQAIVAGSERFWGERDIAGLHHALHVHEKRSRTSEARWR